MGWFRRKPKSPTARHQAGVLDISRLYGNVVITLAGNDRGIDVRVTGGSPQERASLTVTAGNDRLTVAGGDPYGGRRLVRMATGGQSRNQVVRGARIRGGGPGSITVASAGDMYINRTTGNMRVESAQNVHFGRGLTTYLTVGAKVRIVED